MSSRAGRFALVIALIAITGWVHARIPATTRAQRGDAFIPRPEVASRATLGFDAVLADFYWLWAVQVVGASDGNPSQASLELGRLIDLVTTLDPWVGHPYRFAAVWLTDSEQSVRTANGLLERAIEHHPDDWRNYFYKGFNHFFYLDEPAEAAEVLSRAIEREDAPVYLSRLVARLRSEAADLDAAAVFLQELVRTSHDPAERAAFQSALDEVEVEYKARSLDRAREAHRKLFGRDITRVDELAAGGTAVLDRLPDPEPSSLPPALRRGSTWVLDEESGRITSTYYGRRYEVNLMSFDRDRRERWAAEREARGAAEGREEVDSEGDRDAG